MCSHSSSDMNSTKRDRRDVQHRSKRLRTDSSGEFSVEEILPDDMAYDADVETINPDVYEDAESDTDSITSAYRKLHSIDEDLATRMKNLGRDTSGTSSPRTPVRARGRKRRSLHEEIMAPTTRATPELEVIEIHEKSDSLPPRKKTKKSRARSLPKRYGGSCAATIDLAARPNSEAVRTVSDTGLRVANDAMDTT